MCITVWSDTLGRNLSVDEVADLLLGADLLPQTVENFRRRGINGTLLIEASQSKGDCERLLGKQTEYFRRKLQFLLREWKKELAAPATGAARSLKYKCVESMRSEAVCFWLRRLGFPEMIIDKFQLNRVCGSEMIIMSVSKLRVCGLGRRAQSIDCDAGGMPSCRLWIVSQPGR